MNRILPVAALGLFSLLWNRSSGEVTAPPAPDRPLASLLPERCRIYLEAGGPMTLLERGLEHPFVATLRTSALGRSLLEEAPLSPEAALAALDAWLGRPALALLADLVARGIALGIDPQSRSGVIVALGRDPATVERQVALVLDALERQHARPGALDRPAERRNGAEIWDLGGKAQVARREALLVLGNDGELLREVLDLAADPAGRGLLDRPGFARHHERRGAQPMLWSWLELAELEAGADPGFRELRAANRSPAMQLLFGAGLGGLVAARALSATLTLAGDHGLRLRVQAFEAPALAALVPLARAGSVPSPLDGAQFGSALLYRDYSRAFTERTQLFPAQALPGFAEAITNGALFFEGRDLGEDVLAQLSPWIRLVSRPLDFAAGRRPEIPLPGLAVVGVLDDEHDGECWTAAFQSIVSLTNVERARTGGKGLRLVLEREGDVSISLARFATPGPADGVDVRYNLEPAVAIVGRHLVLGTHVALVRDVVRELGGREPSGASAAREVLELDARGWHQVLDQNFEFLVANKMLEDGLERAAAEEEIEGLRKGLGALESARLELDCADPEAPELVVDLTLARAEGR